MVGPVCIVLEFARCAAPGDPFTFCFEPQEYMLRTPGGAQKGFRVEWSETLLAELAALRKSGRDPSLVQRLGEQLRRALGPTSWSEAEREILAAERAGRRVHVTVRANAAELLALPWELLTVGSSGQHLGELVGVVLRYEWPETETRPTLPSPQPEGGRVLLAWSAMGGGVPAGEHVQALVSACEGGVAEFDAARDVLGNASASSLAEALARGEREGRPYGVLHVLCHCGAVGSGFGLVLDDDVVDAGRLRLREPDRRVQGIPMRW